jgi:excinuclease ABC subunit A
LGLFVAVTGVSGSGKSSLIGEILRDTLARDLNGAETEPGEHDEIRGVEHLDKLIDIDQSAIGRTPRSNPATYIKLFDQVRDLYAKLPDAKARGYQPGRFSFNVEGGRCEACQGNGSNRLEMDFLADVWVTCPVCQGHRFNRETLHVRYKGKSIADVLEMDIQDALEHFANIPKIARMLQTLHDVGLDYLKLGQPSPTLSGGEAQRIKLARELVKKGTGKTVYILDEPTTGLHFEDVRRLLDVLHRFTRDGNTVIVIEHNLDVVKTADWVIDLGPEGGSGGGRVIAEGTPEQVAKVAASHTGKALKPFLDPKPAKIKLAAAKKKARTAPPELKSILIRGASQHNLKGVDLDIPRGAMSVCSGPSGSGKSSLAIDTLYAEGQRRYVESLSSYARQFLSPLQKPKVEQIRGLSPAISIEQKTTSKSPRSTVGTVTEIHDYLRVLFARLGQPHCPKCATPIGTQTADEIVEKILHLPEGTRVNIMAPVERRDGQSYEELWEDLRSSGFARVRVDQVSHNLEAPPKLSSQRKHKVEVVVDRAIVRRSTRSRLADSVESALDLGQGVITVAQVGADADESKWPVQRFSQHRSCDTCGRSFDELTPHHFSFNSAIGWCPVCQGLGVQQGANPAVLIPDERKSLRQGAVVGWPDPESNPLFDRMLRALPIDSEIPFSKMDLLQQRLLLHGSDRWFAVPPAKDQPGFSFQFKGLFPAVEEAARVSFFYRWKLQNLVDEVPCSTCAGGRLRDDAAAVKFHGHAIDEICRWPLGQALKFFETLKLDEDGKHIAGDLIREIRERARFLVDVGLEYLSLSRGTPTLSGGESQRIRLASQIGSGLTGVLYVLDEPTIGLHPRDNGRLLSALQRLRDLGNTLVIVEHDREVIDSADALFDFGPGSGDAGGEITARGTPAAVRKSKDSLTGQYLSGAKAIPVPTNRRPVPPEVAAITRGEKLNGKRKGLPALVVRGARHHNLRDLDVAFPLGVVTAVTGVSGSGKSSLVEDVLWKAAAKAIHRAKLTPGSHDKIENLSKIDKVIAVDQSPIGTTPASNPATYAGAFDLIRELYAKLPAAKVRGYTARRFSFNQVGGRCEACEGVGQKKIEMHFLPDVWVPCEHCGGTRYTSETLEVKFRGKSIADVLDMTVDAALELFAEVPKLAKVMRTLSDVGLGYVRLGQSAITLSGGEAQRVKLAAELARPDTGQTLYILDEPTTGLHMDDVRKLLDVIHRLADLGNTVIVIEHNLEVIKTADWVIDIGPDAGLEGGAVVGCGTPEQIAKIKGSHTGKVLKPVLEAGPDAERAIYDPKEAAKRDRKRASAKELMQDAKPPWEVDGRRWHTVDRIGRTGRKPRWDGNALASVIDLVESISGLPEAEWGERTTVKVGEFLKALTSHEWVLTLKFRVPRGLFTTPGLTKRLDLVPFAEAAPPVLCDSPRVTTEAISPTTQEITILIHTLADVQQPSFEAFVREAAEVFRKGEGGSSELAKAREALAELIAKSPRAARNGRAKAGK